VFVPWGTRHCERSDPFAAKGAISTDARRGLLRAQNALAMTEGDGCPELQTLANAPPTWQMTQSMIQYSHSWGVAKR
jgi:hypothetical protein